MRRTGSSHRLSVKHFTCLWLRDRLRFRHTCWQDYEALSETIAEMQHTCLKQKRPLLSERCSVGLSGCLSLSEWRLAHFDAGKGVCTLCLQPLCDLLKSHFNAWTREAYCHHSWSSHRPVWVLHKNYVDTRNLACWTGTSGFCEK